MRILIATLFIGLAWAQMPDGPGREETERLCKNCHELVRSVALHQDRDGWQTTVDKMVALGAKGSEKEFQAVVDYLAKNFPAGDVIRINVNKARAIDLESGLTLKRSQAAAIIEYRAR